MSNIERKRKVNVENRSFNEIWKYDYFVIPNDNRVLCLICKETIVVLKEYNIRIHYEKTCSSIRQNYWAIAKRKI